MKVIVFAILLTVCLFGNRTLISLSEAEKVLGQRARLIENSEVEKNGVKRVATNYIGVADTTVHLYGLSSHYPTAPDAHDAYSTIAMENMTLPGFKKLTNLGDEGFFHSDNVHFYLIIFRREDRIITLKVNKISPETSVFELRNLADKLD